MEKKARTKLQIVWTLNRTTPIPSWLRIGIAWEGADGLLFMQLDQSPLQGQIWLKDWEPGTAFAPEEAIA